MIGADVPIRNQPKDRKSYWCLIKQLGLTRRRENDTLMSGVCNGVSEGDFTLAETCRTGDLRNPWRLPFFAWLYFFPSSFQGTLSDVARL